ncbi:MAG: NfeD family protein [Gammaproteobacteria bacterium]
MDSATTLGIVLLIVGALAAVSEIHTLTIYLIAVAIACFAAAGVALAGGGLILSLIVLAVVILLGMPVAHWVRGRLKNRASEDISRDDVGHNVTVIESRNDALRVSYRGSTWEARLEDSSGKAPQAGEVYCIASREGNILTLVPPSDHQNPDLHPAK